MAQFKVPSIKEILPKFNIYSFEKDIDNIRTQLKLRIPPLGIRSNPDKPDQLGYIERHLKGHSKDCQSMVVEEHYIDRDFIADHSAFYSTSFKWHPNWCRRVHFFTLKKSALEEALAELFIFGRENGVRNREFYDKCREFSEQNYLGFTVIKPLEGSPVGRTVLSHYEEEPPGDYFRKFYCTRKYEVHLLGIPLTVCGLVFQQQDRAVSACATTAIWTSLSKTTDFEDIRVPTPATITQQATQYLLYSGRAMPQEDGLSLHQMCQAIQSCGLAPYVIRPGDPVSVKSYLYSSIQSGFAPILLIKDSRTGHAITVSGMKIPKRPSLDLIEEKDNKGKILYSFYDKGSIISDLYVNDDRHGPYFVVGLENFGNDLTLNFKYRDKSGNALPHKCWHLTYILIPLHIKIRLAFVELRKLGISLVGSVELWKAILGKTQSSDNPIELATTIMKYSTYMEHLFFGESKIGSEQCEIFKEIVGLSRYVGVVRLIDDQFIGITDILIDTTSIAKNPHYLGIVSRTSNVAASQSILKRLSEDLRCPVIIHEKDTH